MSLNINVPQSNPDLSPKITVVGVGGAGGNAVNNMIQTQLEGVEFLVTNSDAQALQQSLCERRIQLGRSITEGLGAGSRPDIGRAAAEESLDEILADIEGAHMVFVTAGMGGGTGTGAASVIARAAREAGILTVGVVTKPFHFEGVHRMRMAEEGITDLTQYVDTLIIIPNQNLFRVANEKTTFADAFKMADDVLESGVRGVTDLMVNPGLINLDFADIRSVMSEMGKAMMGTGEADGENRAIEAAEAAINNPLLDDVSMKGARGVLINITGGMDLTLFEVDEAANRIRDEVDPDANIIFGSTFTEGMDGRMRVSVVATGIEAEQSRSPKPILLKTINRASLQPKLKEEHAPAALSPAPAASAASHDLGNRGSFTGRAMTAEALDFEPEEEQGAVGEVDAHEEPLHHQIEPMQMPQTTASLAVESEEIAEHLEDGAAEGDLAGEDNSQASMIEETPQPSAHESRESFFAPPPAEPEAGAMTFEKANRKAEPFAEADLANAAPSRSRPKRSGPSLFARVTGAAKALHAVTSGSDNARGASPSPEKLHEPKLDRSSQINQAAKTQPRLTGLDAAEKIRTAEAEEELLDIPAFLRRQAN